MPTDFPAAHSMDSCWFAVDEAGHVGFFDTGEGGAVPTGEEFPKGGEAGSGDELEVSDLAIPLIERRAAEDPALAALLGEYPAWKQALPEALWDLDAPTVALFAWLGLFTYDCGDAWATPYVRRAKVPNPVALDALPPEVRQRLANARLALRFDAATHVAVPAHVPSAAWGNEWQDVDGSLHAFEGTLTAAARAELAAEEPFVPAVDDAPSFDDTAALAFLRDTLASAPPPRPSVATPGGLLDWLGRLFKR